MTAETQKEIESIQTPETIKDDFIKLRDRQHKLLQMWEELTWQKFALQNKGEGWEKTYVIWNDVEDETDKPFSALMNHMFDWNLQDTDMRLTIVSPDSETNGYKNKNSIYFDDEAGTIIFGNFWWIWQNYPKVDFENVFSINLDDDPKKIKFDKYNEVYNNIKEQIDLAEGTIKAVILKKQTEDLKKEFGPQSENTYDVDWEYDKAMA